MVLGALTPLGHKTFPQRQQVYLPSTSTGISRRSNPCQSQYLTSKAHEQQVDGLAPKGSTTVAGSFTKCNLILGRTLKPPFVQISLGHKSGCSQTFVLPTSMQSLVQHSSRVRPKANGFSLKPSPVQGKLGPQRQHLPFTGRLSRMPEGPQFTVARQRQQTSVEAPRRPSSARCTKSGAAQISCR